MSEKQRALRAGVADYHGDAGPGIQFLTRLTLLREVNWDTKTQNLVANPVPGWTSRARRLEMSSLTFASPANVSHKFVTEQDASSRCWQWCRRAGGGVKRGVRR